MINYRKLVFILPELVIMFKQSGLLVVVSALESFVGVPCMSVCGQKTELCSRASQFLSSDGAHWLITGQIDPSRS